jgi:hypothetical protein
VESWAALPARYILESDIKTCTPRSRSLSEPLVGLCKRVHRNQATESSAQGGLLSNSGVHGDQIGGDNLEDPRQRGVACFARLLQAGGVTTYVVIAECRRQGGSVSSSFAPGLFALCRVIGLNVSLFSSPEERDKKQRLREVASLSQISRLLRKSGKQKSGLIHFFGALTS